MAYKWSILKLGWKYFAQISSFLMAWLTVNISLVENVFDICKYIAQNHSRGTNYKKDSNRSIQILSLSLQSTISNREVLTLFWCLEHQICSQLFPKWEVQAVNWPVEKWRWGAWTSCEIYTFLPYLWKTGPLGMRGLRAPSFQEIKFEANLGNMHNKLL